MKKLDKIIQIAGISIFALIGICALVGVFTGALHQLLIVAMSAILVRVLIVQYKEDKEWNRL